ncbi:hypothetical protein [Sphingopyxis sp. GW247-27LB]|uniref:hypothetical protein n=1 Tax=Sphingopyxis sp. GW247-27LB TaxID=2012632 RepID=UPI0015962033|nr:hypothetical protein [Sphingopyxis sp. GW247-27LB]
MTRRYHQNGKQVLRDRRHVADCIDTTTAARITFLLNLFRWTDWFATPRKRPCQPVTR